METKNTTNDVCDCYEETLEKVKGKLLGDKIPDDATEVNIEWENYYWMFADSSPIPPRISYSYRGKKNNGEPKANLTKNNINIIPKYCTFCGREYTNLEK